MRLLIHAGIRVEVESELGGDPNDAIHTTHVEAQFARQACGWSKAKTLHSEEDKFDLSKLRAQCPDPVGIELMCSFGRNCGLPLQKRFRTVRHVQKGEKESFARLEVERDGTHVGFYLGPSLIDGSFQAVMALADTDVSTGTLEIPQSIRRLRPFGRQYCIGVWSYLQLIGIMDQPMAFRSWLLDDVSEHCSTTHSYTRAATSC
jgi:hypothetical protein